MIALSSVILCVSVMSASVVTFSSSVAMGSSIRFSIRSKRVVMFMDCSASCSRMAMALRMSVCKASRFAAMLNSNTTCESSLSIVPAAGRSRP